jgi:hypothetical protein
VVVVVVRGRGRGRGLVSWGDFLLSFIGVVVFPPATFNSLLYHPTNET